MTKTIATLWSGNIDPIRYLGENSYKIKRLEDLKERNSEKLDEVLDESAKRMFEAYTDCVNEYISLIAEEAFCDGFCLGTKITAEALCNRAGEE